MGRTRFFVCSAMKAFTVHAITFSIVQFLCIQCIGNKTQFLLPEMYMTPENPAQGRPTSHQGWINPLGGPRRNWAVCPNSQIPLFLLCMHPVAFKYPSDTLHVAASIYFAQGPRDQLELLFWHIVLSVCQFILSAIFPPDGILTM